MSAANGTTINTYGTRLLQVNIGLRRNFTHPFLLASVDRPIIGADILAKFSLIVDLKHRRLLDPKTSLQVQAMSAKVNTPTPKHYIINNGYGSLLCEFPSLVEPPKYNSPVKHNVVHHIVTQGQLPYSRPRRLDAN